MLPSQPKDPPQVSSRVIESFALTAKALRDFIASMPDREVVIRFPYTSTKVSVPTVRSWLDGISEAEFVWDSSKWYVLAKAEKTNGWMCFTFNWRYWINLNLNGMQLAQVRDERVFEQIDDILGLAYSKYEAGISRESLRLVIPELLYCRDKFSRRFSLEPRIVSLIEDPVILIQQALSIWDKDPGYMNASFIGGGFGLGGAIQGMANAHVLNTIVNSYNKRLSGGVFERVNLPLSYGFGQLRATQSILAGKLLFPKEAITEIRHGTGD